MTMLAHASNCKHEFVLAAAFRTGHEGNTLGPKEWPSHTVLPTIHVPEDRVTLGVVTGMENQNPWAQPAHCQMAMLSFAPLCLPMFARWNPVWHGPSEAYMITRLRSAVHV